MANLKTKITTFLRTEKTKRDALQSLLVECINHAQKDGANSFDLLSMLIRGMIQLKSRNCDAIRAYICEHITGIQWTKVTHSNGKVEYLFKRVSKTVPVQYLEITKPWFEHSKNTATNTNTTFDVMARAKSLLTSLTKANEEHKIKQGQDAQAKQLIDSLNLILNPDQPVIKPAPKARKTKQPKGEQRTTATVKK